MTDEKIFIRNVKDYMIGHKLNNGEFAEKIGDYPTVVGKVLSEKKDITMNFVKKVSAATGMSVAQLFTLNPKQTVKTESQTEIANSNNEALIKMLNAQNENLKSRISELENREPVVIMPAGSEKLKLNIKSGKYELHLNGSKVTLDNVKDIQPFQKKAVVEMAFDEILIQ